VIWRVAAGVYVSTPGYSTVWRSSHGLMGTLYTRLGV
jgi:hypothetical protein